MRNVVSLSFAALLVLASTATTSQTSAAPATGAKSAKSATARLTGKEAVALVANMPEVKSWKAAVVGAKRKGVTANIELDRTEGDDHVVHVFEVVMDAPDEAHTATFNWYHVNAKTRKITKEF